MEEVNQRRPILSLTDSGQIKQAAIARESESPGICSASEVVQEGLPLEFRASAREGSRRQPKGEAIRLNFRRGLFEILTADFAGSS